jgi:hypothetical protein
VSDVSDRVWGYYEHCHSEVLGRVYRRVGRSMLIVWFTGVCDEMVRRM